MSSSKFTDTCNSVIFFQILTNVNLLATVSLIELINPIVPAPCRANSVREFSKACVESLSSVGTGDKFTWG